MRVGSICSGIGAPEVAWKPLGWEFVFSSEIEPFPSAVLKQHFPEVPNLGDFTTIQRSERTTIDLLVGGTPCQDFSVAGLRAGMAGDRGNLTLQFLKLADRLRPKWLVWENVPGVLSSNGGRDFGAFLGGLGQLGYGFAYRVLDAQYFGVPQRRRRVFVVGCLGDWRSAAAVLFERHSLSGHPAPRREKGQGATYDVAPCIGASGRGFERAGDTRGQDCLVASTGDISHCLNAGGMGRQDYETETLITHSLRGDGFDASEDGTGRGTPLVPIAFHGSQDPDVSGDVTHPIGRNNGLEGCIAFSAKDHGADAMEDCSPTLRAGGHTGSHANAGVMPAVAMNLRGRDGGAMPECDDLASIRAASGGSSRSYVAQVAVRRLTPRECERLQGFPDDYTQVPYRGKPAADGPRYKAIGNSMAVPVMHFIGLRIDEVEKLGPVTSDF